MGLNESCKDVFYIKSCAKTTSTQEKLLETYSVGKAREEDWSGTYDSRLEPVSLQPCPQAVSYFL